MCCLRPISDYFNVGYCGYLYGLSMDYRVFVTSASAAPSPTLASSRWTAIIIVVVVCAAISAGAGTAAGGGTPLQHLHPASSVHGAIPNGGKLQQGWSSGYVVTVATLCVCPGRRRPWGCCVWGDVHLRRVTVLSVHLEPGISVTVHGMCMSWGYIGGVLIGVGQVRWRLLSGLSL